MRNQPLPRRRATRGPAPVLTAVIAALAIATLAAAGTVLWQQANGVVPVSHGIPSVVVLLFAGLVQCRMAWISWQSGSAMAIRLERLPLFWRYQSCGPVACYLVALLAGPGEGALSIFLAALAAWQTLGLSPFLLPSNFRQVWAIRLASSPLRTSGWAAFALLGLSVLVESAVQLCAITAGEKLPGAYMAHRCALVPGINVRGRLVNERGYWDEHRGQATDILKVAALGDSMLLAGSPETNHLSQAERRLPGVAIYNFGRPLVGPREYEAQLDRDVAAERPNLVLAYISIGDDVCEPLPAPSLANFDWRGLGAFQWTFRSLTQPGSTQSTLPATASSLQLDREAFLRTTAPRLAVCRAPISPELEQRWTEMFAHLEGIQQLCQRHGTELGLVLVPGEFQVSTILCESLRRHAGYEPNQIDLELPQRRLLEFASRRDIAVLDLLPHLRASHESPYERNDVHWNDHGNDIAAAALTQWLQRRIGPQVATTAQAAR